MEHLGIRFSNEQDFLQNCIEKAGICVLHAPLFHPAMKHVAPIRRDLGLKTFFNMLGPLVNPSKPNKQMVGVFNLELQRIYRYVLDETNQQYSILHALDGYDEISLTGDTKVVSNNGTATINAASFGLEKLESSQIGGGDTVDAAAAIFMGVLEGKITEAQKQVVCANAGIAIATAKACSSQEGYAHAVESIESGKALQALQTLQQLSAK
jgi:anthranilate phosphoribosyltransferase